MTQPSNAAAQRSVRAGPSATAATGDDDEDVIEQELDVYLTSGLQATAAQARRSGRVCGAACTVARRSVTVAATTAHDDDDAPQTTPQLVLLQSPLRPPWRPYDIEKLKEAR